MIQNNDPGFSSDRVLTEYVRLNEIDWSRSNEDVKRTKYNDDEIDEEESDFENSHYEGEGI